MKQFFWYCSGANFSILKKCPTEESKYVGIGATVFFTGLLASLSGGYALYTVFKSVWASMLFGLVWGAMIFNLDRYIVSSMKKQGGFWGDFKMAIPRMILAVLLALVISKPLELRIFQTEINAELITMEQKVYKDQEDKVKIRYAAQMDTLRGEMAVLKSEISNKEKQRNLLDEDARKEADGTGGSGNRGLKTIYAAKKADAEKAQTELNQLIALNQPRIDQKNKALSLLDSLQTAEISKLNREHYDGFASRIDALGHLTSQSNAIWMASLFITLLFIAIETAPVFVKLLSPRGPYDDLLEKHEHAFGIFRIEQMSKLNQKTNEKLQVLVDSGNTAVQTEMEGNKELMRRILEAETEVAQEIINKWKAEELSKMK